jgi:hypothetical protein
MINVFVPFVGYVKIPSREIILLHFRFVLKFSARSRYYYAPFSPHSE